MDTPSIESSQRRHYNNIGSDYEDHYSDRWSLAYREEFLCAPMFHGLELQGTKALDALCGGGQLAMYLHREGSTVSGLDISEVQIEALERRSADIEPVVGSVFQMPFEDNTFDVVGICNALHHLHPRVDEAIREVHRVLKPGGCFGFSEPSSGTLPDVLRNIWYRFDPLFEESEKAIDLELLKESHSDLFEFHHEEHTGNVAYIAVLNSLILRIPRSWKDTYAPLCISAERVLKRLLPRFFSCAVVCSWRKKSVSTTY